MLQFCKQDVELKFMTQKTRKTQKDKKLVPQNNKQKMQTQINPY